MKLIRQWFVFAVVVYACMVFYPARLMLAQGVNVWLLVEIIWFGGLICGLLSVLVIAFFEGRRRHDRD